MANYFSTNLKKIREKKGLSQNKLGNMVGVNQTTIARWENKEIAPSIDNVEELANALNIPLPDLLGKDLRFDNATFVDVDSDTIQIPVLGKIPAGMPLEAIEDTYTMDTIDIPKEWLRGNNKYFALKLEGNSMEPDYLDKDIVIFKQANDCESGQDCCIRINGFDATFKRVRKQENGIMVMPLNENNSTGFVSTFYSKEEIINKPVEILGVVKQIRRNK